MNHNTGKNHLNMTRKKVAWFLNQKELYRYLLWGSILKCENHPRRVPLILSIAVHCTCVHALSHLPYRYLLNSQKKILVMIINPISNTYCSCDSVNFGAITAQNPELAQNFILFFQGVQNFGSF